MRFARPLRLDRHVFHAGLLAHQAVPGLRAALGTPGNFELPRLRFGLRIRLIANRYVGFTQLVLLFTQRCLQRCVGYRQATCSNTYMHTYVYMFYVCLQTRSAFGNNGVPLYPHLVLDVIFPLGLPQEHCLCYHHTNGFVFHLCGSIPLNVYRMKCCLNSLEFGPADFIYTLH